MKLYRTDAKLSVLEGDLSQKIGLGKIGPAGPNLDAKTGPTGPILVDLI